MANLFKYTNPIVIITKTGNLGCSWLKLHLISVGFCAEVNKTDEEGEKGGAEKENRAKPDSLLVQQTQGCVPQTFVAFFLPMHQRYKISAAAHEIHLCICLCPYFILPFKCTINVSLNTSSSLWLLCDLLLISAWVFSAVCVCVFDSVFLYLTINNSLLSSYSKKQASNFNCEKWINRNVCEGNADLVWTTKYHARGYMGGTSHVRHAFKSRGMMRIR